MLRVVSITIRNPRKVWRYEQTTSTPLPILVGALRLWSTLTVHGCVETHQWFKCSLLRSVSITPHRGWQAAVIAAHYYLSEDNDWILMCWGICFNSRILSIWTVMCSEPPHGQPSVMFFSNLRGYTAPSFRCSSFCTQLVATRVSLLTCGWGTSERWSQCGVEGLDSIAHSFKLNLRFPNLSCALNIHVLQY